MEKERKHTELDTGVVLTNLLTLLVGEEHVRGKTTLGRVGVCWSQYPSLQMHVSCLPFFFLPPSALDLGAALRVVFSLGMVVVEWCIWLWFLVSCCLGCKQRVGKSSVAGRHNGCW